MRSPRFVFPLLIAVLGVALLLSIFVGEQSISPGKVLRLLWPWSDAGGVEAVIVRELRLPRALGAALVGAALALAGAVMQGIFRNPLADPGLIGVSAGGAVGAVLFLVFGGMLLGEQLWLRQAGLTLFPIIGGIGATLLVYRLAQVEGRTHAATLLLIGVAVNAFAGAVVGYAVYFAPLGAVRDFAFWSLGSLDRLGWPQVWWLLVGLMLLLAISIPLRGVMNLLLLGESEALHLGVPVERIRRRLIFASAGAVGLTVAFAGTIGFVGLVVPHLCRLVLGPDHRILLPAAALSGAALLTLADVAAGSLLGVAELPIGILTATLGAPFFVWLIARSKRALG